MTERRPHPATGRAVGEPGRPRERRAGGERRGTQRTDPRTHGSHLRSGRPLRAGAAATTSDAARRRGPKSPLRLPLGSGTRRLHVVLVLLAMGLSICAGRLLQLQGFDSSAYAAESAAALTQKMPLLPARGEITDRNGTVLAATEPAVAVTADPSLTGRRPGEFAEVLARHLEMPVSKLLPLLTKPNTRFVYVKKKVPAMTYTRMATELAERNLYGVFREGDPIRTYPNGSLAGPIIGYLHGDGRGAAGLEGALNSKLAGVRGQEVYESAPNGSRIPLGSNQLTPAQDGYDYRLTLDSELQWAAERRIAQQVAKSRADFGFAITMNVKTGEILALAQAPTYDPNNPPKNVKDDQPTLSAVTSPYEPGSVQKVLTMAALLDSGAAGVETARLRVPNRLPSLGSEPIKDHFEHKTLRLNMRGVVAKSSNIGTVMLARQMRTQDLYDYLHRFGLGVRTGIEVPGENAGLMPGDDLSGLTRDRVAFGQGLAVTGIQEVSAIAGVVNGGVYHPPTLIASATDGEGKPVALPAKTPRRIVSAKTSAEVRDLMRAVVDGTNGQSRLRIEGYTSGGKTGTAQRGTNHGYDGYITSYIGFAPLNDPQIITYVVINNPRRGDTGSQVAAPVYRDIMQLALPRYSVEPSKHPILKPKPTTWQPG